MTAGAASAVRPPERLLVTGGCGFIGVNLVAWLRARHPRIGITVVDDLSLGRREHLDGLEAEFIEGDIRDSGLLARVLRGKDAVVHLAAHTRVEDSIADPDLNFDVNVVGTYRLLRAARDAGIESFVMASTGGAIVGEAEPPIHEGIAPRPLSPYGASKLMAEGYLCAFAASYGMRTAALRFSNVYGPRSFHKGSVVAKLFRLVLAGKPFTVYGDGSQTRDYVFVEDLSEAIFNALSVPAGGRIYQLGTGIGTPLTELVERVSALVRPDYELVTLFEPFRAGEVRRTFADISLARRELGFAPKVGLQSGLEVTWDWFRRVATAGGAAASQPAVR